MRLRPRPRRSAPLPAPLPARRQAVVLGALAAVVAVLILRYGPPGGDLAAHTFQREFFLRYGFSLWNNYWYAGQYVFVTYSLLFPPLAAAVGVTGVAAASAASAGFAFTGLVTTRWGPAARPAAVAFAVTWPAVVLTGAVPFGLGAALALLGARALQRGRVPAFALAAAATLAASPLAFLFLAVALGGLLLARRREWRRYRWPAATVAVLGLIELILWRLFPSAARYPFWREDFAGALAFAVGGFVLCRSVRALEGLRGVFLLYGGACLVAFTVPNPVGANMARVRLVALPLALLLVTVRRWHPRPVCLAVVVLAGWWNTAALVATWNRDSADRSAAPSYWDGTIRWLSTNLPAGQRVEVVDTAGHWAAAYVADAGIPLARGWYRQADFPQNGLLYQRLSAAGYDAWLRRLAVDYVVLSDVPPDFSARQEADLLSSGRSGLSVVRREGPVTIYAVPAARAMVTGPGEPRVTQFGHDRLRISVHQPGEFHLAVRWSPYWEASRGCLARAPDGMTTLRTVGPGMVTVDHRVRMGEALRVLAGREERCDRARPGLERGERPSPRRQA